MGLLAILKGEQPGIIATLLNYKNVGQFGEYMTEYALKNNNLKGEYIVLKNAYIPIKDKNTEIDLIMVHEKGIFVFESKNYSGYIFGKANEQNWVQKMENGSKHVFYNPIKQNNTHIIALANYLSLPISAFTSYIIFSERCELTKVPKNTKQVVILQRNKMLKNIRKELSETYGNVFKLFDTQIPRAIKVAESTSQGESIFSYDKNSKVSTAYNNFALEVLKDGEKELHRSTNIQTR